jgi:hypothetical protein
MSTRDSGVIDLFAIHKEEEARVSAAPSAPPPAFALDVGVSDEDIDGYVAAEAKSRARTKLIGGVIGGFAVVGIIIGAIAIGSRPEMPKVATLAAPDPPPAAMTAPPPPAVEPPPAAPVPPPPATAKSKSEKPEYTPATAAAAYAASQGKKKGVMTAKPGAKSAPVAASVKLQKVQSSGIGN